MLIHHAQIGIVHLWTNYVLTALYTLQQTLGDLPYVTRTMLPHPVWLCRFVEGPTMDPRQSNRCGLLVRGGCIKLHGQVTRPQNHLCRKHFHVLMRTLTMLAYSVAGCTMTLSVHLFNFLFLQSFMKTGAVWTGGLHRGDVVPPCKGNSCWFSGYHLLGRNSKAHSPLSSPVQWQIRG